jgi:hypothetical protein
MEFVPGHEFQEGGLANARDTGDERGIIQSIVEVNMMRPEAIAQVFQP